MALRSRWLLVVLTAAAAWGSAGAGQSIWRVMVWTDPLTVSIDTASITATSTRITARVKWDYSDQRMTQDAAAMPYRSMMGVVAFDCAGGRFGAVSGTSYAGDDLTGAIVSHFSIRPDQAELSHPGPGTVGQDMLSFVCAEAAKSSG